MYINVLMCEVNNHCTSPKGWRDWKSMKDLLWVNKYGLHGKENFFQGKNVQTNKGKAKMVEQPRPTTYKEALQKHNSFSDDQVFNSNEDDCLCERCSRIMARVFGKVAVRIESPLSDIDFGPIVEPRKVEWVFSRVERPKQLLTFKPPVGEPNKWYSMESVSVKPPQKHHFKYGYNFHKWQEPKGDAGLDSKCISHKT